MPYGVKQLNNRQIQLAKNTTGKVKYLNDGDGLLLKLHANGSKIWLMRFYLDRKQRYIHLGHYPLMSLLEARSKKNQGKKLVGQGIHPTDYWNKNKEDNLLNASKKFMLSNVYQKVMDENKDWSDSHKTRYSGIYNNYLKKRLGGLTLYQIDKTLLKDVVKSIPKVKVKGVFKETAKHSTMAQSTYLLNHIYNYAIEELGFDQTNPTPNVKTLKLPQKDHDAHHKAVKETFIGEYWYKVKQLQNIEDRVFLKLNIHTVLRVNSQTCLTWRMFDPTRKILEIPKEIMKARRSFTTHLTDELVEDILALKKHKQNENKEKKEKGYVPIHKLGKDDYIFTTPDGERHYSNNRCAELIKRLGENFKEATAHGNRTLFHVTAKQQFSVPSETIEFHLAHKRGDSRGQAINNYMGIIDDWEKSRLKLVRLWSEYLNSKEQAYILSIKTIQKAQSSKSKKSN